MADELDAETKLRIYRLVLTRYRDLINQKETKSISEIRQAVSPYSDFIRKKREEMLKDIVPYSYPHHFFVAMERATSYIRSIKTCEFSFAFSMSFKEIDDMMIATAMDKAILLAALLRAFESPDAKVVVTHRGRAAVRFSWKESGYLVVPDSGSILSGDEITKLFSEDPAAYSFNDLVYEDYEDD